MLLWIWTSNDTQTHSQNNLDNLNDVGICWLWPSRVLRCLFRTPSPGKSREGPCHLVTLLNQLSPMVSVGSQPTWSKMIRYWETRRTQFSSVSMLSKRPAYHRWERLEQRHTWSPWWRSQQNRLRRSGPIDPGAFTCRQCTANMQRAVHMFKRVGTAWIMSGLRMLRSCITTNNWAQRSSDVFGVCESGMEGPIYPTCSGIWRNWLNCQVIVIHGKCQAWNSIEPQRLRTRVPRWKSMRHMPLSYSTQSSGAEQPSSATVLPPFSPGIANQNISEYVWS